MSVKEKVLRRSGFTACLSPPPSIGLYLLTGGPGWLVLACLPTAFVIAFYAIWLLGDMESGTPAYRATWLGSKEDTRGDSPLWAPEVYSVWGRSFRDRIAKRSEIMRARRIVELERSVGYYDSPYDDIAQRQPA